MRLTIKLLLLIVLMLGTFGQHTNVAAAEVIRNRALSAFAYSSGMDPTGCISTEWFVQGIDQIYKNPPGPGESTSTVYLQIIQYDYCAGPTPVNTVSITASVPVDEEAVVVDKKLGWATIDTTISVYNYATQSYIAVDLDLTWSATGPATLERNEYKENTPHCHWMMRSKGLTSRATISGTISYGGATLTVNPSIFAAITSTKSGELTVGCE